LAGATGAAGLGLGGRPRPALHAVNPIKPNPAASFHRMLILRPAPWTPSARSDWVRRRDGNLPRYEKRRNCWSEFAELANMARSTRLPLGLAALTCACAVPGPGNSPPEPRRPVSAPPTARAVDVKALSAREAGFLRRFQVTAPRNRFRVQVRAAAPPVASVHDGATLVEMPIGSEQPIRCQVFDERVRVASTFARLLAKASKVATVERVEPWKVEVIKETPITFARLFYSTEGLHGPLVGELKAALHSTPAHAVLCYHDELGYEQTFLDEARAFSQSITHADEPAPTPAFTTIRVARLDGMAVGFEQTTAERDRDPARIADTLALLVPVSKSELTFVDAETVRHIDGAGRLIDGTWTVLADGATKMNVELRRENDRAYRYAGETDGGPLSGRFELRPNESLAGEFVPPRKLGEKAATGRNFAAPFLTYDPRVDATRPVRGRYFRDATDPAFTMHEELGAARRLETVDDLGVLKDGELALGTTSLLLERVFSRGTPWAP
jgi:hypothetical protein